MMNLENQPLTPHQQVLTEYREGYSQRLIEDGATRGKYGSLLLSDVQLELLQATGEPLPLSDSSTSKLRHDETGRQNWLMTPINDIPLFSFDRSQVRLAYELTSNGLHTIRDVLIFGRAQTGRIDKVGLGTVQAVQKHVSANTYGIVWVDRPSAGDISVVSANLDDVKLRLVRPVFDKTLFFMPRGFRSAEKLGTKMPDLLSVQCHDLARKYSDERQYNEDARAKTVVMAERAQASAVAFAHEFYSAR